MTSGARRKLAEHNVRLGRVIRERRHRVTRLKGRLDRREQDGAARVQRAEFERARVAAELDGRVDCEERGYKGLHYTPFLLILQGMTLPLQGITLPPF